MKTWNVTLVTGDVIKITAHKFVASSQATHFINKVKTACHEYDETVAYYSAGLVIRVEPLEEDF